MPRRASSCASIEITLQRAFFERAIDRHDVPTSITIDKSGANTVAIGSLTTDAGLCIKLRQNKYLNNLVEQDHRAGKRRTKPMLGFTNFWSAWANIAGNETAHMIRKGQLGGLKDRALSAAQQFYSLAF